MTHYYAWGSPRGKQSGRWMNSQRERLYRKPLRIIARGKMNSALVEFEHGERQVISRNALRRIDR